MYFLHNTNFDVALSVYLDLKMRKCGKLSKYLIINNIVSMCIVVCKRHFTPHLKMLCITSNTRVVLPSRRKYLEKFLLTNLYRFFTERPPPPSPFFPLCC